MRRDVGCTLGFRFHAPSLLALQVAVSTTGRADEDLQAWIGGPEGGDALTVSETVGPNGGRVHLVQAPAGPVTVRYRTAATPPPGDARPQPGPFDHEVLSALHQSRYCPSDLMGSFARTELPDTDDPLQLANAAASWVFERIAYELGTSGPSDTALDTMLAGRGICRDFAHLTIAMCRAVSVPARLVAVYAPGVNPMDFHAVVEVWVGDRWLTVDPSRLAPRSSMVRVATGRDAADTALTATVKGDVELETSEVLAVVEGDLPPDDHTSPYRLG